MKFERKRDAIVEIAALMSQFRTREFNSFVKKLKKRMTKMELEEFEFRRRKTDPTDWLRRVAKAQEERERRLV